MPSQNLHPPHPTSYPEVNAVLHALLSGVLAILGDSLVGLYLYGSLADGDFNPQTSDIDFIVVTVAEIPEKMIAALEALHQRLWASESKWTAKLEGMYLPQESLRRYNPDDLPRPAVNEGRFYLERQDSAWIIQRYTLREHGVVVAGPPLRGMIDPVTPGELKGAVAGILGDWWAPLLHDPSRLHTSAYQAYAVLTMCRALYALKHGTIVSKPEAARWAQAELGDQWQWLVEAAAAWQPGLEFDSLDETLDFIQYTLERSLES